MIDYVIVIITALKMILGNSSSSLPPLASNLNSLSANSSADFGGLLMQPWLSSLKGQRSQKPNATQAKGLHIHSDRQGEIIQDTPIATIFSLITLVPGNRLHCLWFHWAPSVSAAAYIINCQVAEIDFFFASLSPKGFSSQHSVLHVADVEYMVWVGKLTIFNLGLFYNHWAFQGTCWLTLFIIKQHVHFWLLT